jgi:hypothetical protein
MSTTNVTLALPATELELLDELCQKHGLSRETMALKLVGRELAKVARSRSRSQRDATRSTRRTSRQLALTRYLERHGMPKGLEEKHALAEQLGINVRTLYRYLEIADQTLSVEQRAPALHPARRKNPRQERRLEASI